VVPRDAGTPARRVRSVSQSSSRLEQRLMNHVPEGELWRDE